MTQPTSDPAQLFSGMMQAGQQMMQQWTASTFGAQGGEGASDPLKAFTGAASQFTEVQQAYLKQAGDFWGGLFGVFQADEAAPLADKRFAGEAWESDPRFDAVRKTYLAYANFLSDSANKAQVDEKTRSQLQFSVRQFLDAMSPANFLATNPEAMQLAMETGGRSLTEGMQLFMQDLAKGRVSMTDETAFAVGKDLAITPGAVIYENELIQIIQYSPTTSEVYERPLLIVPPCINKFYILDLQPENSFVSYAVAQGHTLFMVSWRNITPELGHLTWDDYLEKGVLQALTVAQQITGADRVNTLGFCVGGTLLSSALSVLAARDEPVASSMTLLTTMLDYFDTGEIGLLVSEQGITAREAAIGKGGILQGKELAFTFSSLRANDLIWQYVVNSYLKGKAPPAFDLLYWNSDSTNLPGPMFCWYVRNTYLENNLRVPGKTSMCGVPINLSQIDVPTYLYASREDHIVPWKTAYASRAILPNTTFVLGASGHIAGAINPPQKKKRNYWVEGAPASDAERWFAGARSVPGSWWPHWAEWLAASAGDKVPADAALGNETYRVIEPAPGRYVMALAD